MKKLMILCAIVPLIMATGCKKKNTNASDTAQEAPQEKARVNLVMMTFSKSTCYGRCPAYTATIMPDGKIDFNAQMHTPVTGSHTFQAEEGFVEEVLRRAEAINFFELQDKYDNEYVTDLPSTTLMIEQPNRKKTVMARHEVPQDVTDFYTYIHEEIMKLAEEKKEDSSTNTNTRGGVPRDQLPKATGGRPIQEKKMKSE